MNLSEIDVQAMIERIEFEIATQKLSKKDFYERSGVSSSLYSQWNTGTVRPSWRSIGKMAEALGVSIKYLIGQAEETEEKEKSPPSDEDELMEELQMLRDLPERRALLHATKGLTADQVRQMADFLEGMKRQSGNDY